MLKRLPYHFYRRKLAIQGDYDKVSLKGWKWSWPKYWLILMSANGAGFVMSWYMRDDVNSIFTMGMFVFCGLGFIISSQKDEDEE